MALVNDKRKVCKARGNKGYFCMLGWPHAGKHKAGSADGKILYDEWEDGPTKKAMTFMEMQAALTQLKNAIPSPIYGVGVPPEIPKNTPEIAQHISEFLSIPARKALERIPDRIEVIVGFRAWLVQYKRICPLALSGEWEPKKAIEANCVNGHNAPFFEHACGIWAFKTPETLSTVLHGYTGEIILGSVAVWGRVIECQLGYRAQFAYPTELWVAKPEHEELGRIYGVPVRCLWERNMFVEEK